MLFFNYAFPLIFFFLLSAMLHAERGGSAIAVIVTNVLVIGILGNGFFGAGIRAVQEREQNILRRFKVAPISPLPILGASLTTGLLLFIPAILLDGRPRARRSTACRFPTGRSRSCCSSPSARSPSAASA